ncbi:rust resistance kinase Lr10-like [Juglans microcarpa x Juglans regia]|uniref:rust resistance kinase Lr10-like n=1 Tax=Juglans microcarpa x Juglans regia TaxID=2249226 RepID=UPI001B7E0D1A|nr:rust resistance kinase Lr10-like [Juglans microcarpa x Juglans regia]
MAKSYFFLFVLFILHHVQGQHDECADSRQCGAHGPAIRFPFRLNDGHPDHCGFPGFHLSCSDTLKTVLELPNSVKLFVKKIDYKSQEIQVYHPDRCFPKGIRQLNLSSSPFQFAGVYRRLNDFAFFNCSHSSKGEEHSDWSAISCLNDPSYSHQVYALRTDDDINELPTLPCRKMYTVRSIPYIIVFYPDDILYLNWSRPACRKCELKGMNCRSMNINSSSTESEIQCFPKHNKGSSTKLVTTGAILGPTLLLLLAFALYRVYSHDKAEKEYRKKIENFLDDYRSYKPTRYLYADLKRITNQFTEKLGEGAYGTVFRGKLSNEIHVAVKILNSSKGNGEEFINEVGIMGKIHHVNVVRLVGFCADGFRRALVYEFFSNYSLEKFIFSENSKSHFLGWERLHDISLGVAKGIEYLHQGCDQRILHFDIKPHNVLLDQNFIPKISDFGLAKLCSKDQSAVSMSTGRGTMGYIAPEVFSRNFGTVSYKADVYSFGMLLLEIVGGRRSTDITSENASQVYFPEWIYNLLEQKVELRVFIEDDGDMKIAKKLAIVGLRCIQWHPMDRPSMKLVVQMLEGEGDKLTMPPNPFASPGPTRIHARKPMTHLGQELDVIQELD